MTARSDDLAEKLSRYKEIKITVTGRKSGHRISLPVWFVSEGERLYLLPVKGSETQWYKNVLEAPTIEIDARGSKAQLKAVSITDSKQVSSVVERFRAKYGPSDVKRYYSKFDVAVSAPLHRSGVAGAG